MEIFSRGLIYRVPSIPDQYQENVRNPVQLSDHFYWFDRSRKKERKKARNKERNKELNQWKNSGTKSGRWRLSPGDSGTRRSPPIWHIPILLYYSFDQIIIICIIWSFYYYYFGYLNLWSILFIWSYSFYLVS